MNDEARAAAVLERLTEADLIATGVQWRAASIHDLTIVHDVTSATVHYAIEEVRLHGIMCGFIFKTSNTTWGWRRVTNEPGYGDLSRTAATLKVMGALYQFSEAIHEAQRTGT